jgi:hypothetical protein
MQKKLTLRLEDELIERAKIYAKEAGRSVSQLVADYFAVLDARLEVEKGLVTPLVRSMKGALREVDVDVDVYRRDRDERHI